MPCGGPSKDGAYKRGDEVADAVMLYLATLSVEKDTLVLEHSKKQWEDQAKIIRDAIKEMVWIDHAEF